MRIKVVIPNSSVPFRDSQIQARKSVASSGTTVEVVCLTNGPVSIESAYDEALAGPYIINEVEKAEKEGFDAVSLDCAMDTVVRAAKESVTIPVTSAGEAGLLIAMGLCSYFSVVTVLKSTAKDIEDNIRKYGFNIRCKSVRYANIPVLDLCDTDKAVTAIRSEGKRAIFEDGAECIVLGCTGMSELCGILSNELNVPVIDPASASIQLAEMYVSMRLSTSKYAFELPNKNK